jgi:hypothetical protein
LIEDYLSRHHWDNEITSMWHQVHLSFTQEQGWM